MFTVRNGRFSQTFTSEREAMAWARKDSTFPVTAENGREPVTTVRKDGKLIAQFCDGMLIWLNGEEIS